MTHNPNTITESKRPDSLIFTFDKQEFTLDPLGIQGRILDLGGGGEGTIGQLEGERVVAIAPMFPERFKQKAAQGPLKIIMDGRDLKFLDASFPAATSFFTLMYIPGEDHGKVFDEVYRVLVPGGRFFIWDVSVPICLDENTEQYLILLKIHLPEAEINTGYGQTWPGEVRDLQYYGLLAEKSGFMIQKQVEDGRILILELVKPTVQQNVKQSHPG